MNHTMASKPFSASNAMTISQALIFSSLTSKATFKIVANILKYSFSFLFFFQEIRLDISYELSAQQTIHMKYPALFSEILKM